ncbi:MAG: nucleotidyltransferase domain-containing protein [Pseudomonadota bacterium]
MIPDSWKKRIIDWANREPEIREVWLYGSRARGDHRCDSDIDLAIVPLGDAGWMLATFVDEADRWQSELQSILPVTVDLDFGDAAQADKIVGPALSRDGVRILLKE